MNLYENRISEYDFHSALNDLMLKKVKEQVEPLISWLYHDQKQQFNVDNVM